MDKFPNPLLCLYCDKRILPGTYEGARLHMFKCTQHPARQLIDALKAISMKAEKTYNGWTELWPEQRQDALKRITRLADLALEK